ncbi:MAG: ABC transporter substrate-binding protein [Intestinimonas sp.]|jgi:NitT/TauT family transport system substrate-binding protein|nr:ABC transporter substrate-binding protein [Intestinimonas sp.]
MKRRILALLSAAALLATLLSGCGSKTNTDNSSASEAPTAGADAGKGEDLIPIKIAFCTWVGYAPLFIAKDQGYFETYGYDADLIIMEDESTYGSALVSGSIDALGQVLDRDIIQYDAGAPEQYVCTMDASTGGDGLVATGDIQSVDDLKGKTVALDKSATSYFFFLQVLADSNITEKDVNIVEMGNDEAGEAFIAGNVDAAVTWEPQLSNCSQREGGHVLVSSADYPKAIMDVLTVNSNFTAKYPKANQDLAEIWNMAIDYLNANYEAGCQIMADGLDLDLQDVKDSCEGITFYGQDKNAEFADLTTEQNVMDVANQAASFWLERGYMKSNDLSGFFPMISAK